MALLIERKSENLADHGDGILLLLFLKSQNESGNVQA